MTSEEAKDFLTHYICSCQYGTSPTDCDNAKCKFGIAVRTLCNEDEVRFITQEDYYYNKKKHRWEPNCSVPMIEEDKEVKTNLCKTCKKGDSCENSTKIFSKCCSTSICYKYEEEKEND